MPSNDLRSSLLTVLKRTPRPRRIELHALLHRLVSAQAGEVRKVWLEPGWREWKGEAERQIDLILEEPGWPERLAQQIGWIGEPETERLLVFSATLLRTLDRYHRRHVRQVSGVSTAGMLFLSPPEMPIAANIPAKNQLGRGAGDLRNDLRAVLDLWWHIVNLERHAVQPRCGTLPAYVSLEIERRLPDLRIGLAAPFSQLEYVIHGDLARCGAEGSPYRFSELAPGSVPRAREELEEILRACAQHRIDVLCFPELTLDPALLFELQRLLKTRNATRHPVLVMAGSFHVPSPTGWVNRCQVLDAHGNLLVAQDKCVWYRLPASQATPELCATLGIDERGGHEDITPSGHLELLDSSLGRLATPICLDYCGTELRDLLVESSVNVLLVPAMTPEMKPFRERAWDLGTQNRAVTFVVNSGWLLRQLGSQLDDPERLRFAYLPSRGLPSTGKKLSDALFVFSIGEMLGLP